MSRKRSHMPDVYRNKKRSCTLNVVGKSNGVWDNAEKIDAAAVPCDTKAALLHLKSIFPYEKFERRLPPIIIKHQVYSIVKNRTLVDKELGEMRSNGEIRLFKLGMETDEFCIVFTSDYYDHVCKSVTALSVSKTIVDKFFSKVISQNNDLSLNKHTMMSEFQFKDDEITQLVKLGVLTVRDVGSWWIAIPCAGIYMKSFVRGRKAILMMIRKCKYKEILQKDLEERKLPKIARLGISYHIHDIIGAELVECIETTSGQLLRLSES